MIETVFMSLTLVLLVYIAYIQHKSYGYTQYILVATAAIMTGLRETKEWLEGEEDEKGMPTLHLLKL
jgi:hypothetical protein